MEYALQNNPVVAVYHPQNESLGHAFANVNWAGYALRRGCRRRLTSRHSFLGGLTGISSAHVGISEKHGDNNTLAYTSRMGIPFHVRDPLSPPVVLTLS